MPTFRYSSKPNRFAVVAGAMCCAVWLASAVEGQQRVREPLPLDIAVATNAPDTRSAFDLSPDGEWLAHTWAIDEAVPAGRFYTATGVSFAEGNNRKQAGITSIKTGQVIKLGNSTNFNWAPVWSPDGSRLAYYSDEGGEAGIWIWEKATGKSERFPGVIVRSFFGFEIVRWSSDSHRILCKILPEGMSVAQANALLPATEGRERFPKPALNEPSVIVFKALSKKTDAAKEQATKPDAADFTDGEWGDLAILDLRNHSVSRIAKHVKAVWFSFSPDEKYVAYTSTLGREPNTQQFIDELELYAFDSGRSRKLADRIQLGYGIELNWSPDSRQIAYISSGQRAKGEIVVVSVADGAAKNLSAAGLPSFNDGEGERPPVWDATGKNIYALGNDGKLWRIEVSTGRGTAVGDIPGHRITGIVTRARQPILWTTNEGHTAWVIARERQGTKAGIFRIDLASGHSFAELENERTYYTTFNLDASDATGEITYIAKDQQHLADAWVFNTASNETQQVTHLNEGIEHYELGSARIIDWKGADGQRLRGALLLPPGYEKGRRLPLAVWVYGGANGSNYVNSFGFWSDSTWNFHILATRGYAVLYPDAPLRTGMVMKDLVNTVVPGIDAAIEQGYADPNRLAVMGQSYGSYCTLALICQTKRFKAAVITAAILHPDLVADYLNQRPEAADATGGYYEHGQGNLGRTPWEYRERYLANSPIYQFDQIETPLLIGQGNKDGNLIASDAIFAALKRLGKDAEYRIYKDEGHVLESKPNVNDFWQRRLEFLAEHLNLALDSNGAIIFDGDHARPANP